jgi:hypothetical protein
MGEHGVLVSRLAPNGGEVILDLICRPAARRRLLRRAQQTTPDGAVSLVACGRPLAAALRAAGWLVRPREQELVALSREVDLLETIAGADFLCFAGESDIDLLRRPLPPGDRLAEP